MEKLDLKLCCDSYGRFFLSDGTCESNEDITYLLNNTWRRMHSLPMVRKEHSWYELRRFILTSRKKDNLNIIRSVRSVGIPLVILWEKPVTENMKFREEKSKENGIL